MFVVVLAVADLKNVGNLVRSGEGLVDGSSVDMS